MEKILYNKNSEYLLRMNHHKKKNLHFVYCLVTNQTSSAFRVISSYTNADKDDMKFTARSKLTVYFFV